MMNEAKHWYVPAVTGGLIIIVGAFLITVSEELYPLLSPVFGISFIACSLLDAVFSIINLSSLRNWKWYLTQGVFTFLTGSMLLLLPDESPASLALFAGFVVLLRCTHTVGFAIGLKDAGYKWIAASVSGATGLLLSVLLIAHPAYKPMAAPMLTAFAFACTGAASIALAFAWQDFREIQTDNRRLALSENIRKRAGANGYQFQEQSH